MQGGAIGASSGMHCSSSSSLAFSEGYTWISWFVFRLIFRATSISSSRFRWTLSPVIKPFKPHEQFLINNGVITIVWCCCSHLNAIGIFNLLTSCCGITSLVTDITSSCRFCFYQHLKSADSFIIVEAKFSKQHGVFDSKYSQNRQKYYQKQISCQIYKSNFLWNVLTKANFLWNFLAIKGTHIPWQYSTFFGMDCFQPNACCRLGSAQLTTLHWSHTLWWGPSCSPLTWDCQDVPSVPFHDCLICYTFSSLILCCLG